MASRERNTPGSSKSTGGGQLTRPSSFYPGVKDNQKQNLLLTGNRMKTGGQSATKKPSTKKSLNHDVSELRNIPRPAKDFSTKAKRKVADDVKERQAKFDAMIEGDLSDVPHLPKSVVRIFLSSTFSDMRAERNTLAREVYPILKEYCASLDLDFQVVDMRWGVTEDSQNDHSVEELCLQEIKNCQKLSLGPNFVCILGDRYGFQLIPDKIESSEFRSLFDEVMSVNKSDGKLLSDWFVEDHNSVPHQHILQPIRTHYPNFGGHGLSNNEASKRSSLEWDKTINRLRTTLRTAAFALCKKGKLKEEELKKYNWSVTECEISLGVLKTTDPQSHSLFFHRELVGLSDSVADDEAHKFIDVQSKGDQVELTADIEARSKLSALTKDIPQALGGDRCFHFSIPWRAGGIDPSQHSEHSVYIFNFCKTFIENVTQMIDTAHQKRKSFIKRSEYYSDPEEVIHHLQFCLEKCKTFCGRKDTLKNVKKYVLDNSTRKPLVIHAHSGAGKTSLMAFIMKCLSEWFNEPFITVIRFLGTSPGSVNLYDVLFSVCGQLADAADLIMEPVGYQNFPSLVQYMPRFLRRVATAAKVPIVILLDSVDQLSAANGAYLMKWLPLSLPPNVHLILSTLPQEHSILTNIKERLPDDNCYLQVPILEDSTVQEIAFKYLKYKHRILVPDQMIQVTEKFKLDPSPLFLKLLLDKAVTWHSYTKLPQMKLGDSAINAIHLLFEGLETKFGRRLIETALGFITVSLNGITEIEMEDALSCDDQVLNDVYEFHDPPVEGIVRIPPLLWARIHHDLKEYLVERLSQGKTTFYWYHRQFIEVATDRYLSGNKGEVLHKKMLEIYLSDSGVRRDITLSKRKKTVPRADRQVTHQPMIIKNRRKLECVTHHLINARNEVAVLSVKENVFCNYEFLSTKISAFSVQHVIGEMDRFLTDKPDKEIQIVRDFLETSFADLRYPMQLAVHLLAGVASPPGSTCLENLLRRARECVYSHPEPLLVPVGPCFAPRGLSDRALTHCLAGCTEVLSISDSYICTKEEGVEEGEAVCALFHLNSGEHRTLEQFKLKNYITTPVLLEDGNLCLSNEKCFTLFNIVTEETKSVEISLTVGKGKNYVVLDSDKLLGILDSKNQYRIWNLNNQECIECVTLGNVSRVTNVLLQSRENLVIAGELIQPVTKQTGVVLLKNVGDREITTIFTAQPIKNDGLQILQGTTRVVGISEVGSKGCEMYVIDTEIQRTIHTHNFSYDVTQLSCFEYSLGHLACTITTAGKVNILDLDNGQHRLSFCPEEGIPTCIMPSLLSVSGNLCMAIGGSTGLVTLHNLETGEQNGHMKAFENGVKRVLLADGNLVAYSESTQFKVWDLEKLLQNGGFLMSGGETGGSSLYDETVTTAIEVSLCNRFVYTSTRLQTTCMWSIETGQLQLAFPCGMVATELKTARGESELLIIVSKTTQTAKVFDTTTGKEAITSMPKNVLSVVLSRDKRTLYVVSNVDGRLKLHEYELPRLKLSRAFLLQKGLNFKTVDGVLSQTERYIILKVECTADDRKSIESQWKKGGFAPQPHPYRFSAIDLTHTSGALLHCFRQLSKIPALGSDMVAHTGNTMIFCVRRCVCFWDIPTGRCDQMITKSGRHGMFYNPTWLGGGDNDNTAYATHIVQSYDRRYVVLGSDDGYVTTYRADSGTPVDMRAPLTKHNVGVSLLSVSNDTKWLISACKKNILKLWNPQTAKELFSLRLDGAVKTVHVSPDSKHLVVLTGVTVTRVLVFRIFPGKPKW